MAQIEHVIPAGNQPDGDVVASKADGLAIESTTPLGANDIYESAWVDTDGWRSIELVICTDAESIPLGVTVEYSDDVQAPTPTVRVTESYEFGPNELRRGFLRVFLPTSLDGVRIRFENNGNAQSFFFLQATFRTDPVEQRRGVTGGIITSTPWVQLHRDTFEESGALPSGSLPAFDASGPIVAANVLDTGWLNVDTLKDQFFELVADIGGLKVFLMNASDDHGNNSPTTSFNFPTATTAVNPATGVPDPIVIQAPFFQRYFRIVIINDSGSTSNAWAVRSQGGDTPAGPLVQSLNAPIFDGYQAAVGQNIIKGKVATTGAYLPVAVDAGGNLKVSPGSKPSDSDGAVHVDANVDGVATSQAIHTVTAGYRFQLTSIIISAENISIVTNTNIKIRDGGVLGAVKIPFTLSEATNQTTSSLQQTVSLPEPIPFDTDVYLQLTGGTPNASVTIVGFEVPV